MSDRDVRMTRDAFEYQWGNIPDNRFLLSDSGIKGNISAYLSQETGMQKS